MALTRTLLIGFIIAGCAALWWLAGLYLYLSPNLLDADTLRDVKLQTPMKVMSSDGRLIGQFGEQKRSPLQFDEIPNDFVNALLAAEDDHFFEHGGVDLLGLARAVSELIATGRKRSGGSTLTMQVARNYALTLEQTFLRKFNEILLALEVEDGLLAEGAGVHVAGVDDQLVGFGLGAGDDEAVGIDDHAAAQQRVAVLVAGLGHAHHPGRVLIGAGLHRQL